MATNYNWTLSSGTDPLDVLKSAQYCNLTTDEFDEVLETLGEMITSQIISYLNTPSDVDNADPPMALVRAALKQTTHEFKQRATPGLSTVTYTDGTINKMQIDEWLKDVEKILNRYRRWSVFETVPDP